MPKHSLQYGTPAHIIRTPTHITHKDMKKYSNIKEISLCFGNSYSKNHPIYTPHSHMPI